MPPPFPWERVRRLLIRFGEDVRDSVLMAREAQAPEALAEIAAVTAADTIYRIDRVSEEAILRWFSRHWPADLPAEIILEGCEDQEPITLPKHIRLVDTKYRLILDPVDGTRCAMHDKRSAWVLAAAAPQRFGATRLADLQVAAMTEIPVSSAEWGEQVSGVRGAGRPGILAESINLRNGRRRPLSVRPSGATDCRHGFGSFVKFFPEAKGITAQIEELLWKSLYPESGTCPVFDDQYLSTAGQIRELISGKDRFVADLRPLLLGRLGKNQSLTCHPYDICTGWLLEELGGVIEHPGGGRCDAPLDTTSPVAWVGYANPTLAREIGPALRAAIAEVLRQLPEGPPAAAGKNPRDEAHSPLA